MLPARRSALLALVSFGTALLCAPAAHASSPPLPHQVDIAPGKQNLPARLLQLVGSGKGHNPVYLEQKAPGDVTLFGVGNPTPVRDVTAGISEVGDVVYVPQAPDGGSTPTQVTVHDTGTAVTVPVAAGERYLSGAGDHSILLASSGPAGITLTLRNGTADTPVTTLPAGSIGAVTADATTALLAFTPAGASAPVIDAVTLAGGTVTQVNATALTAPAPLVALSAGSFAWSDTGAITWLPRTGGSELRRTTTGEVTALAVVDDAVGWIAGSHLFTAVADPATDPIDHGVVSSPGALAPTYGAGFVTGVEADSYLWLYQFIATQAAHQYGALLDQMDAVVSDVRLTAGRLIMFQNSATPGVPSFPFLLSNGEIAGQTSVGPYVGTTNSRRLMAFSGRFEATGSADDTSLTVTTRIPAYTTAPGPDLTVPIARGVDTIELSGYRLLVHRPGSAKSQLYTIGSSVPVDYPLVASVFGARIAWLNPDGSVQTRDLTTGATATVRSPGTAACASAELASTTVRVAGDEIFWSLCGENRVHRISTGTDLVLPDGDMTDARLGTGALAVLDPATHVLSVTDVDTGTSYPVADAPAAFDVDDRFVAWADNGYTSHLAPLPFDNTDVGPQLLAEWGDTSVVPADYTSNQLLTFWHHQADLTQPVSGLLQIPAVGFNNGSASVSSYWPGSLSVSYDGQDYHTSEEPAEKPGLYAWSMSAAGATGPATALAGSLAVRDPRPGRVVITSWPRTLVAGSRGTINMKVLLGSGTMPAATIVVETRPHGTTTWKTVRTTTASTAGSLAYTVAPTVSTDYRFVHPADTYGPAASTSATVTTLVAAKVTARLSSTAVRTGSHVTLSGGVLPAKPGQLVSVQRYSSGAWHTVAYVKLSSASTYRMSLEAAKGSVNYRVARAADRSNVAGTSPAVTVKGT
jgi:hypothetical protein